MHFRRRDEGENPAWPGLVDVFAFTLVFIILLWFGTDWHEEKKKLEEEVSRLRHENIAYRAQIQELQARLKNLEEQIAKLKGGFTLVMGKALEDLSKHLQPTAGPFGFDVQLKPDTLEISILGRPPIYFDTARYDLSSADLERLSNWAPGLYEWLQGNHFYVLINGTADPRELRGRGGPPRDNIELSALRAATVAGLLEKAAPGLGKYLRVVGLGVMADASPLALGVNPDEVYRKHRTVDLVIKVDVEKMMRWLDKPGFGGAKEGASLP
jgi:flagellar motor protein MotB